jgi:hypothetical protein
LILTQKNLSQLSGDRTLLASIRQLFSSLFHSHSALLLDSLLQLCDAQGLLGLAWVKQVGLRELFRSLRENNGQDEEEGNNPNSEEGET